MNTWCPLYRCFEALTLDKLESNPGGWTSSEWLEYIRLVPTVHLPSQFHPEAIQVKHCNILWTKAQDVGPNRKFKSIIFIKSQCRNNAQRKQKAKTGLYILCQEIPKGNRDVWFSINRTLSPGILLHLTHRSTSYTDSNPLCPSLLTEERGITMINSGVTGIVKDALSEVIYK